MYKYWVALGVATTAALLIVVAPFLPQKGPAIVDSEPLRPKDSLSVLFVGDIMLDRSVAVHAREVGDKKLFEGVKDLFAPSDVLVGNLEGTLTTNPSVAQKDNSILRFTFEPKYAQLLADLGFTAVSLANNHALDFGEFGYDDTLHYLNQVNIAAFGSPYNDSHLAIKLVVNNKTLCLVGYHALFAPAYAKVVEKIEEIRAQCEEIVVMTHWGEEYQHEPIEQQKNAAHAFVDAGADVIIGAHPHVVQPLEVYKGHAIFYSLGNFLFDQGWRPEVRRGFAVEVVFEKEKTRFVLTPVNTYKEVTVAEGDTATAVLKDILTPELPQTVADSILKTNSFELVAQ